MNSLYEVIGCNVIDPHQLFSERYWISHLNPRLPDYYTALCIYVNAIYDVLILTQCYLHSKVVCYVVGRC